jgi:hypothetical protein
MIFPEEVMHSSANAPVGDWMEKPSECFRNNA